MILSCSTPMVELKKTQVFSYCEGFKNHIKLSIYPNSTFHMQELNLATIALPSNKKNLKVGSDL